MEQQPTKVYNINRYFESGSINIENIYFQGEGAKQKTQLPDALKTPEAQELLKKVQAAGWLDEEFRPVVNKTMTALIASRIGRKLDLTPMWKPFEEFWGVENLSKIYSAGMERKGSNKRIDEIDKALN